MPASSTPRILAVGAGLGGILEGALKGGRPAGISIEEPNPLLLKQYCHEVSRFPRLSLGQTYEGPIQDLYGGGTATQWLDGLPPQDLILAVHMIYHLTHFAGSEGINPEQDLKAMF